MPEPTPTSIGGFISPKVSGPPRAPGAGPPPEVLVAAAFTEELAAALDLCSDVRRLALPGVQAWHGTCSGRAVACLRTGFGPERAARSLSRYLAAEQPDRILVIGYGGALDPALRPGALVAVERAVLLARHHARDVPLEESPVEGAWPLDPAPASGSGGGSAARVVVGTAVTSPWIIGAPPHKAILRRRFEAAVVDMETAALARECARAGVPLACVRAISDAVDDTFLAPFTYDPGATMSGQVLRALTAGGWLARYRDWRRLAAGARASLTGYMERYFRLGV